MKCRVIDANVILRFLLDDVPEQAERCQALLTRLQAGSEQVYLPQVVLCDVVWTLTSFYRWPRERVAQFAHDLISLKGIQIAHPALMRQALYTFVEQRIDFSDALIIAEMAHDGYAEVYSFDRDFDRVEQIKRIEP